VTHLRAHLGIGLSGELRGRVDPGVGAVVLWVQGDTLRAGSGESLSEKGDLGRGIVPDRIVEPVNAAGRLCVRVRVDEVVGERSPFDRLEDIELHVGEGEYLLRAEDIEGLYVLGTRVLHEIEDHTVELRELHSGDVVTDEHCPWHVPASFDELACAGVTRCAAHEARSARGWPLRDVAHDRWLRCRACGRREGTQACSGRGQRDATGAEEGASSYSGHVDSNRIGYRVQGAELSFCFCCGLA
jgi:hypothetical protein